MYNKINLVILFIFLGLLIGYYSTSGSKTQLIRLVDIFLIGPLMIYIGIINFERLENIQKIISLVLIFFGASTITFNLKNYILN